jgi:GT2 family glycosyltransferase
VTPDVTVSIVNHSSWRHLEPCLDSLQRDDAPSLVVELVVLDNASTDGSLEHLARRFPDVRVIAQRHRAGFGANQNAVIDATTGRYVYVLNDDTLVEPGSLERIVAYLDANPLVAAVGPHIVYPDGREQPSAWRFPTPWRCVLGIATLGRRGVVQSGGSAIRTVDWATGAALVLRRSALDQVGTFDEGYFMYCEETDLQRRLGDAGLTSVYLPDVTVVHVGNAASATVPERRLNELWRSRHRYWRLHHSPAGARVAALASGLQHALRFLAMAGLRQPGAAQQRLQARNAWRGVSGPGLAELADPDPGKVLP